MGIFSRRAPPSPSTMDSMPSRLSLRLSLDDDMNNEERLSERIPPIFNLPPEIVQHILSYLSAEHLASLLRTCTSLHFHASEDKLWIDLLRLQVPTYDFPSTPAPFLSFRDLYLAHHPYWFLPHHKIWFSDDAYTGKLILIKFNPKRGSIEGYRVAAERPPATPEVWSYKPDVLIHHLNPHVYVSVKDPVLALSPPITTSSAKVIAETSQSRDDTDATTTEAATGKTTKTPKSSASVASISVTSEVAVKKSETSKSGSTSQSGLVTTVQTSKTSTSWTPSTEIPMRIGAPTQKIEASLLLSINLPEPTASVPNVSVWPPRIIPSMPRTRSSQSSGAADLFSSRKHKPQTLHEISQTTFRLRTWSPFTQGILSLSPRFGGEAVSTWSTLYPALYTPTPEKPYQGIFVGDYAAHGCEILLVLQSESPPASARRERVRGDTRNRPSRYLSAILAALNDEGLSSDDSDPYIDVKEYQNPSSQNPALPNVPDPDGEIHKGAIEAIKLTGDINIPRDEHTFVADDIGPTGTIRIANESPFRGARVVKSRGHVAGRGFMEDEFIPSQLFLINTDLLAQYWLPFGHISFYKRIDIDELLQNAGWDERRSSSY